MHRSFLARHVKALAAVTLVLDVVAVLAWRSVDGTVIVGGNQLIAAPTVLPWIMSFAVLLPSLHVLLAVAVWQRLRPGREPSSRLST
jgi:hypothetical protein